MLGADRTPAERASPRHGRSGDRATTPRAWRLGAPRSLIGMRRAKRCGARTVRLLLGNGAQNLLEHAVSGDPLGFALEVENDAVAQRRERHLT
ncbi:MAG: hypothetical protein KatS3mg060_0974 [Dehalococcoidia bacterium]|nr:MAG: hypothetical protein KatS3mg060_0974 [Dehalococcoidia bacterium]